MSDLISRQAAIDAVLASNFSACTVYGRSEEGMATAKELIQAIKNLPSAQPDISTDGTMTVTVPEGTKVKRVLVEEEGTTWGFLLYPEQHALKGKWERPLRKKGIRKNLLRVWCKIVVLRNR